MAWKLVAVAASLAVGLVTSNFAQAGGSTSAPSKYRAAKTERVAQSSDYQITEFSSSSAPKGSMPKR
jgi:hypothetical protein